LVPQEAAQPSTESDFEKFNKNAADQEIKDLNIRKSSEIYKEVDDEVNFLAEGLITDGVNVLAGPPKCGKSTLAFQIAVAVAKGEYVLKHYRNNTMHFRCPKKSNVLIISYEESEKKFKKRLSSIEDNNIPNNLDYKTDWDPDFLYENVSGSSTTAFEHAVKKNKYKLIVIDTYVMMYNRVSLDGGSYKKEYQFVSAIKNMASKLNISILLLHHTVKSTQGDWVSNLYGSQALSGGSDTIHFLERERDSVYASLKTTGRDIEDSKTGLYFDQDCALWRYNDNILPSNLTPKQLAVYEALQKGPITISPSSQNDEANIQDKKGRKAKDPYELTSDKVPDAHPIGAMYLRDIAKRTYNGQSSAFNLLSRLIDKGMVRKLAQGIYITKQNYDEHIGKHNK